MRGLDFSSWDTVLTSLFGVLLFSLVVVGIRLLFMQTIQRRRERENRQINERLKTLIAAYKTLGGSFTGQLDVDPTHLRDLRRRAQEAAQSGTPAAEPDEGSDRRRRIRDAVEAALSDVVLLGTEEQVRLAAQAANDMVAGRPVRTSALVVSLRGFIRQALDLDPVPEGLDIPEQGPLRTEGGAKKGGGDSAGRGAGGGGGGAGGGAGAMGAGMGIGMGGGMGMGRLGGTGTDD